MVWPVLRWYTSYLIDRKKGGVFLYVILPTELLCGFINNSSKETFVYDEAICRV